LKGTRTGESRSKAGPSKKKKHHLRKKKKKFRRRKKRVGITPPEKKTNRVRGNGKKTCNQKPAENRTQTKKKNQKGPQTPPSPPWWGHDQGKKPCLGPCFPGENQGPKWLGKRANFTKPGTPTSFFGGAHPKKQPPIGGGGPQKVWGVGGVFVGGNCGGVKSKSGKKPLAREKEVGGNPKFLVCKKPKTQPKGPLPSPINQRCPSPGRGESFCLLAKLVRGKRAPSWPPQGVKTNPRKDQKGTPGPLRGPKNPPNGWVFLGAGKVEKLKKGQTPHVEGGGGKENWAGKT